MSTPLRQHFRPIKVFILAAGLGTRLKPLTNTLPKALVEVAGKPMLQHWLEAAIKLHQEGWPVLEFIVNSHHHAEQIASFLGKQQAPFPIYNSFEPEILGTGGGLAKVLPRLLGFDCLLANVDILTDYPLSLLLPPLPAPTSLRLLLQDRPEDSKFLLSKKGQIVGWEQNSQSFILIAEPDPIQAYGFCGIHLLAASFIEYIASKETVPFSIIELYDQALRQGLRLEGQVLKGFSWVDIGSPSELERANALFKTPSLDKQPLP